MYGRRGPPGPPRGGSPFVVAPRGRRGRGPPPGRPGIGYHAIGRDVAGPPGFRGRGGSRPPHQPSPLGRGFPAGRPATYGFSGRAGTLPPGMLPARGRLAPPAPGGFLPPQPIVHPPPRLTRSPTVPTMPQQPLPTASQVASRPSPVTTAPVSAEQIRQAWTAHAGANGVKYYYNAVTRQSTYEKPAALNEIGPWHEYKEATTGRSYYFNGVQTTWERPAGLGTETKKQAPPQSTAKHERTWSDENTSGLPAKKQYPVVEYQTKEEALVAFQQLLADHDASPTQKWSEIAKLLSSKNTQNRWEACERILTVGERKQALTEYQTRRANELRTKEREKRQHARKSFLSMLHEIIPLSTKLEDARYEHVRDQLKGDDRFNAVDEEGVRIELFDEFCEELYKRLERQRRARRKEAEEQFRTFLRERFAAPRLSAETATWSTFAASLPEEYQDDRRIQVSDYMSDNDRKAYFETFRRDQEAQEASARDEARTKFQALLGALLGDHRILPSTPWNVVVAFLNEEAVFGRLTAQEGASTPRKWFDAYMDEVSNVYRRDRQVLLRVMEMNAGTGMIVGKDTSLDDFCGRLRSTVGEDDDFDNHVRELIDRQPVSSAALFLLEKQGRTVVIAPRVRSRKNTDADSSEDEGEIVEDG